MMSVTRATGLAGVRFGLEVEGREIGHAYGIHNARTGARTLVSEGYTSVKIVRASDGFPLEEARRNEWGDVVLIAGDLSRPYEGR